MNSSEFYENYKWLKISKQQYYVRINKWRTQKQAILPFKKRTLKERIEEDEKSIWENQKCNFCEKSLDLKYFNKSAKFCRICQEKKRKNPNLINSYVKPEHKIERKNFVWLNESQKAIVKKFILDTWNNFLIKWYYTFEDIYYFYSDNEEKAEEIKNIFNLPDLKIVYLNND